MEIIRQSVRIVLVPLLVLVCTAVPVAAERALTAAGVTVFVKVLGNVHVEASDGVPRTTDRRDVEVAGGTGFVISPYGYILTAHHVVARRQWTERAGGLEVRVSVEPTRVEVSFPGRSGLGGAALPPTPLTAAVTATDSDLDLAVLAISATELPYLALGDSTLVERGQPVEVLGYPFGKAIDAVLGNAPSAGAGPQISTSRGTVTALRGDATDELRFIQMDAAIHAGNSGGPLLDADGYVIGVVLMQLEEGGRETEIGFAVPVNRVKDFMVRQSLDQFLPTRRVQLGAPQDFPKKGLSGAGAVCANVPASPHVLWISPQADFTVSLRVAWWPRGAVNPNEAASACGGAVDGQPRTLSREDWAGVAYVTEAAFHALPGGGLAQLAIVVPVERMPLVRSVWTTWLREAFR